MLGGGSATPPLGSRPLVSKCTGPGRGSTCSTQSIVGRYLARTAVPTGQIDMANFYF